MDDLVTAETPAGYIMEIQYKFLLALSLFFFYFEFNSMTYEVN